MSQAPLTACLNCSRPGTARTAASPDTMCVERRAGTGGRRGGGQRVGDIVGAAEREVDFGTARGAVQREAGVEALGAYRGAHVAGAEIRARAYAEGDHARTGQRAPQAEELVVGVDDGGRLQDPGPPPSRLPPARRRRGCRSPPDAPRPHW